LGIKSTLVTTVFNLIEDGLVGEVISEGPIFVAARLIFWALKYG
jgi:hypothetical protein